MAIKRSSADHWFSMAIRTAQKFTCEHCSRTDGRMECAHIVGRRVKVLRWSADNALCLCHSCHRFFTEQPLEFARWLEAHLGQGMIDLLTEKRRGILKDNKATRDEVARHYREETRRLEAGGTDLVSWN